MPFLCIGRSVSVVNEAKAVAYVDLVLAIIGIFFGLLGLNFPKSFFYEWDVFSYRINSPESGTFPADTIITISTILLLSIFLLELLVFFVFTTAIKQLDDKRLNLWFKIRLGFFILSVLLSVYRTINMRDSAPDLVIWKGVLGIFLIIYRGYGLLVVTFLEEIILKEESLPIGRNTYSLL